MQASDEPLRVQPLSDDRVDETAQLVADAMEVDPAYRYLFAARDARARGLPDFFARNLRVHLPHRCTHVAFDAHARLVGTVTLRPPGGLHIDTLTMLRRGLLPFAFAHGRDAVRRLFWLKRTYDTLEAELGRGAPHWYVHMMAVAPERQGTGIGGRLLQHVLAQRPRAEPSVPAVLTTHLPRNVVFYRRAGFDVISERTLQPPEGEAYSVWSMRAQ
jgi:ribosomal protein S18 acetylase RimI-like enzyme